MYILSCRALSVQVSQVSELKLYPSKDACIACFSAKEKDLGILFGLFFVFFVFLITIQTVENSVKPRDFSLWQWDVKCKHSDNLSWLHIRYDFIVDLTNRKNLGINNDYSLKSLSGHYKSRADTYFSQVYFVRWAYFLQIHLHQQLQQRPVASVSSQPAVAVS